ncbi:MAG TPA: DUF308 domain-containing protein [Herpetosiphonaceae bacterium]
MVGLLRHNWWLVALRGISAIILALLILVWPSRTLLVLLFLFGVYTLIDGLLTLIAAYRTRDAARRRWWLVFEGVMGIIAGILTVVLPGVSAQFVLILLAIWAITTGVAEIRSAVHLRREIVGEWVLGLGGIVSVLFGLLLMGVQSSPALVIVLLSGYAFVFGLLLLALAVRLKWAAWSVVAPDNTP